MTPSDKLLIARLRALPEPQRAIELERALTEDPALRERRADILAAPAAQTEHPSAKSSEPRSPESVVSAFQSALEVAPTEAPGNQVGPYQLLQKIGEGGFSTVWLADQLEPVRRKVAVKILKLGMDTEEVLTRFAAERQALALMDHPNIARVFDAGATSSGRPYFAMELVRGVAITRYCDENRLPAEARLRLFVAVCQAVQHAHQKGVIHRDLKPSNILVTMYDGVPVPKVIDFGIAKATGVPLTEKTFVTQFHAFLGTPAYTSPEQMEMSALDVDTRSDIYSLGVLLYELLCGRLPFDTDTLAKSGLEAMRRIIREVDPPRPSSRLDTLSQVERTTTAKRRGTDAAKLSLLLRGDLDWIVMRCLEKDRRRRYDTATGLAEDIEHHLSDEPVAACPPSWAYRLQKSIRRHRIAFGAAAAFAFVLAVGTFISTWQAIRATRAEHIATLAEHEQSRLRAAESALRQRAEVQALTMRRLAYESDMNGVQDALAKDNLGHALELLNRQRPQPGELDLRGWEWRHLWQRCRSESTSILNDKPLLARQLTVSADGKWLAVVRIEDASIELWNLRTREHSPIPVPPGTCHTSIAFSPAEPLLAIATAKMELGKPPVARLLLWNTATRQNVRDWPMYLGPSEDLGGVVFSADGTQLLVGTGCTPGVWSVADGQLLRTVPNPASDAMAMTPDFSGAAITGVDGHDGWLRILDTPTGKERALIRTNAEYINTVAFSSNGKLLATADGGEEVPIRLWDATSGDPLGTLEGHHISAGSLIFCPDGKTLVSGGHDSTIRLWDLSTRRLVRTLRGHQGGLTGLALLPDGETLISAARDGTIRLWNITAGESSSAYSKLDAPVLRWRFDPDSQSIVTVDGAGRVRRWHGRGCLEHDELATLGQVGWGFPLHTCLATNRPLVAILKQDDSVQVWNWETRTLEREIRTTTLPHIALSCVGFVDNGQKLLLNWCTEPLKSFGLYEWDLATGKPTRSWPYSGPINFPSGWCVPTDFVSADGRRCVECWNGNPWSQRPDDKGPVSVLELDTGVKHSLPGAVVWYWGSASFSSDGRWLVAPWDSSTTIWDLQTFGLAKTLPGAASAAFSPDGSRLVFGNGELWDTNSWKQVLKLEVPSGFVTAVGFSPDGNVFAAHSQFGVLHLWRAPSWAEIDAAEKAETKE